ncbi:class I SAM-dependent methyltransferase [Actinopolymorpha pittospori]|uniref:O-methyltransferase YrrM n=1 Tax=Actinopolymorpha pittospori TaxID=648752 RepID=A0A927N3W2_9ACTN|nr:class I SAM-dependent methyltransferase [Actinopolymorpha pittospori]MBE1611609.1 putative O-methyltransferase YrrM [Actinopolymorpha pittospori]
MTAGSSRGGKRGWGRSWVVLALVAWCCAVVVFALLASVDIGITVVLLALGPLVAGLVQTHRQHRRVMARLDRQAVRLDEQIERLGHIARIGPGVAEDMAAVRSELRKLSGDVLSRAEVDALVRKASADVITRTRKGVAVDLLVTFRQIEALQNLYALSDVDRPMPQTRGWAASPDLLLLLASIVERQEPALIVECGSGASTLWLAMVLRRFEIKGRVVALEHQESYVETSLAMVERHELGAYVDIRHAPLEPVELGGETYQWYARSAWDDLAGIELLFVDGPPADTGRHSRYPAFPLLVDHLHSDAVVVLDDMIRVDEQEVLARWLEARPDYEAERVRLEKNAALVRRRERAY